MSTETKRFQEHPDRVITRAVDFNLRDINLRDIKQRSIGARISVLPMTVIPFVKAHQWDCADALADEYEIGAEVYRVTVQPTRSGRGFGASQSGKIVSSLGVAELVIEQRLTGMRNRYRKLWPS